LTWPGADRHADISKTFRACNGHIPGNGSGGSSRLANEPGGGLWDRRVLSGPECAPVGVPRPVPRRPAGWLDSG